VTCSSTDAALAPGYVTRTPSAGTAMSGSRLTGVDCAARMPAAKTITTTMHTVTVRRTAV